MSGSLTLHQHNRRAPRVCIPRRIKLELLLPFLLLVATAGCMTQYDVTMGNGDVVRARTKPKLNEQGYYTFEDLAGKEVLVNRMRVRQIETVRRGSKPKRQF